MNDKERGIYEKFKVERMDGSSAPGRKHYDCRYFVLDLDHDRHARRAILAYAASCQKEFPKLAADLRELTRPSRSCGCRSAGHELGCLGLTRPNPSFGRE